MLLPDGLKLVCTPREIQSPKFCSVCWPFWIAVLALLIVWTIGVDVPAPPPAAHDQMALPVPAEPFRMRMPTMVAGMA
ncbi:MAG: hypothetical protein NTV97_24280 [Alphaproteobacteria bacterium]|nr:hypothetical protein [Alphaproteobacteria bacterium]